MTDHAQSIQDWSTGNLGEGQPALPVGDIRDNIDNDLALLGTLTYFQGDIPATATGRPNGVFMDYDDLYTYLESGGLIFIDPSSNAPVPNPIVYIYASVDPDDDSIEYEVYIDEDS